MTYEQQFTDALKSIFVGAKVEGASGYINLMKIKANYFEQGVFPVLMKDIDSACKPFPKGFREELFDKLYDFFQHYFSESGSIYFRNTAQHHNIYEKVYTDDRDVMLFWKTHMLYYVKTDRLFNSMEIEVDEIKFFFDVSGMELKRSNEKRELTYTFKSLKDGRITLVVSYSEKGRKTKMDEIIKSINVETKHVSSLPAPITEDTLEKAFAVFQKQSEVDYFINKNAKAFLQEQFDLWMYQYVFKGESEFNELRLKQLQAIKGIAYKIIDFIAQFEDELVKVWNKPKFALNSAYVITLDHVIARSGATKQSPVKESVRKNKGIASDEEQERPRNDILQKIFKHKGMKDQIAEWIELGMVDKKFKLDLVLEKDLVGEYLHPQFQFLPLDTKYFKDLELDILAIFDDPSTGSGQGLDAALDGWLIHSENYQALNTLLPKFQERVKCIYIDPPYNTGTDGFIYRDKYFQSSWLSMIENRLALGAEILSNNGVALISIDDYEVADLRLLTDYIFGNESFVCNFVWRRRISSSLASQLVSSDHEYVLTVSANRENVDILGVERDMSKFDQVDNAGKTYASMPLSVGMSKKQRPNQWYELKSPKGKSYWPPDGRVWCYYPPTMENKIKEGKILWPEDFPNRNMNVPRIKLYPEDIKKDKKPVSTWINEKSDNLTNLDNDKNYLASGRNEEGTRNLKDLVSEIEDQIYPKPISLVQQLCGQFTFDGDIILDFFGGSGTTAHAVMNLNRADGGKRKYILVEMGEHFNTVILPRVKKVAFSSKWKDGKADLDGFGNPSKQKTLNSSAGLPNPAGGISHFVKYFELEQYEDALKRAKYEDAPLFAGTQDAYTSYVFLRDLKLLEAVKVDKKKNKVEINLDKLYPSTSLRTGIDLAETLSCLTGKWIKRITQDTVEFEDGTSASLSNPEWEDVKPLIWW